MMETKIAVNYVKCRLEELGGRQLAGGASFQLEHITAIVAELDRLTALCDEYRGEVERLKSVEARVEHIKRSYAGGENWLRCLERAEKAEADVARLTQCLTASNINMERTERELYLRLGAAESEIEALGIECDRRGAEITSMQNAANGEM